jgi:Flp pilus assembly CpaE family ATPase
MPQRSDLSALLIEDQEDAAKLVQHFLANDPAPIRVDWASNLASGLQRLSENRFQVVLLDLNLPDSQGIETLSKVRRHAPDRTIVVLTAEEDENLALRAVREGADEYLLKSDIRARFLARRIRYAAERNRMLDDLPQAPARCGSIFNFIGAKGGSGTTTMVLNLAAAWAKAGKSVAAIELMPEYGAFAAHLRTGPQQNIATLFQGPPESVDTNSLNSCLLSPACGFRVLLGPQFQDHYVEFSSEHVRALLRAAAATADYVLVDMPVAMQPSTQAVLAASAFTTIVVESDWVGLHAARVRAGLLLSAGAKQDALGAILVNKFPVRQEATVSELARKLGCGILGVIPPASEILSANNFGIPAAATNPYNAFSESIYDVADRLSSHPVRFATLS